MLSIKINIDKADENTPTKVEVKVPKDAGKKPEEEQKTALYIINKLDELFKKEGE